MNNQDARAKRMKRALEKFEPRNVDQAILLDVLRQNLDYHGKMLAKYRDYVKRRGKTRLKNGVTPTIWN